MDIRLREVERGDAEAIFALRSDPRLKDMQYRPSRWESPELYVECVIAFSELEEPPHRCSTVLVDGRFAGHVTQAIQTTWKGGRVIELGWNIIPELWGRGIAKEAIGQVLEDGFCECACVEFVAFCFASNTRCQRVLDKLRFESEPPSLMEGWMNWFRTMGRQRLLKYRLTGFQWTKFQAEAPVRTPLEDASGTPKAKITGC